MVQLEDYLVGFTADKAEPTDYVAIDVKEDDVTNGDSVAIDIKDEASTSNVPSVDSAASKSSKSSKGNHELKLFWLACSIIPVWDRWVFIIWLIAIELISSLMTFSLMYKYKAGIICTPILLSIMRLYFDNYKVDMMFRIKREWNRLVLDYFNDLPQIDKQASEDMTDFKKMIDRSANSLYSIFSWGLPILISGARKFITIFTILILEGYWEIIFSTSIIYLAYFYFYMIPKQKELAAIRTQMKEREKWVVGLLKWTLNLFQMGKREPNAILEIEDETDALERSFYRGWDNIAGGMTIISAMVTFLGLASITDWAKLLFFKIIFDDLRGTIVTFSNFANSYASRSKDFDKILSWYMDTNGREDALPQQPFPEGGLIFRRVDISLGKFTLCCSEILSITAGQFILLRGKSGAGKTQLVKAIQGILPGAKLLNELYCAIQYSKSFEYLDQHMRASIPSAKISFKQLFKNVLKNDASGDHVLNEDDSADDELLMVLISIVQLNDKIASICELYAAMKDYCGGEKMKVGLVFILFEVIKKGITVLVLDEPEQGLDAESRLTVIGDVIKFLKTDIKKYNGGITVAALLIYHGDDLDIVEMRGLLTDVWTFKKVDGVSIITEEPNLTGYCKSIVNNRRNKLDELEATLLGY
jgi:energy-coupling factor transporter ATP-binding protein EcfA2